MSVKLKCEIGGGFVLPLICLLLAAAVVPSLGSAAIGNPAENTRGERFSLEQATTFQRNNSTVQHENPNEVDETDDLTGIKKWLSGQLSETLVDCTNGLEIGQYKACDRLDEDYPDWLSKYIDIANTTESSEDNSEAESFERAKENQQQYASNVEEFRRTLSEYRKARENGNTVRARNHARELQRLAEQVSETGTNLTQNYRTIGETTQANTTEAIVTIDNITRNVTGTVDEIEREQFVNATIVADASSEQFSFVNPLVVTGQLTTDNGTALANRMVQLQAGNRTLETITNATGRFSFSYRPTMLTLNTEQVTVRYVPADTSVYLGNETTLPVEVKQVMPTINASLEPNEAQFDDRVTVSGRVNVDREAARSVPVSIAVDEQRVGRVRTSSDGRFEFTTRVPADVPTGEQAVKVSLPTDGRALAGINMTRSITIRPTSTALTVNGSQTDGGELRVAGRLTTKDGTPIAGQSIDLQLNGTTVGYARTTSNGTYATTVTVPRTVGADQTGNTTAELIAIYDDEGTNLEPSRARTSVRFAGFSSQSPGVAPSISSTTDLFWLWEILTQCKYCKLGTGGAGGLPQLLQLILGTGTLLIALGGYGVYRRRNRDQTDQPVDSSSSQDGEADMSETDQLAPLDIAREQLAAGDPDRAVATAYAATRSWLDTALRLVSPRTHWDFAAACEWCNLSDEQLDTIRRLTATYEQAAFAPDTPSDERAAEAIECAHQLNEDDIAADSTPTDD
jgi:hypothetical protein